MYRRVMAFDFDGTLAVDGKISPEVEAALEQCRALGHALFLVTGRRYESISLGRLPELCTGIVWENGAVLVHQASGEVYLPFGAVDPALVDALDRAGVPLERGLAIVATWTPHDRTVWEVLSTIKSGASVDYNKGAVMILPAGAAKGAGLHRLLTLCGFSVRNLAAFGDAENDLSMLTLAEVAVAVADAVPAVVDKADVVASQPGPAGVLEVLERYPLAGQFLDIPLKRSVEIPLGHDDQGNAVTVAAARLVGRNLGIFGDSGTGKSWMAGLLAEGLQHADYQILIIDVEGDFRALQALPRFIAFEGDLKSLPPPTAVVSVLEAAGVSVVLDLSRFPVTERARYLADLFRALRPLRERKYRPHWIVLEEAQQFLSHADSDVTSAVEPLLPDGGLSFVSYRPDRLSSGILKMLHQFLLTRLTDPHAIRALSAVCSTCFEAEIKPSEIPSGRALLSAGSIVRLRPSLRRIPHIRHLYKYMDTPLPPHKRFWFRDEHGAVGAEAASLFEFLRLIPTLPLASLQYHDRRQDFVRWAQDTLGDADLAARLRKLSNRQLGNDALREALRSTVADHYEELKALRN